MRKVAGGGSPARSAGICCTEATGGRKAHQRWQPRPRRFHVLPPVPPTLRRHRRLCWCSRCRGSSASATDTSSLLLSAGTVFTSTAHLLTTQLGLGV